MANRTTCVGVFHNRTQADEAVEDLRQLGIERENISVVMRGQAGVDRFGGWDNDGGYRAHRDDDVSAGEGAVAGGLTGLLIGAGLMLIPGVGPIFAIGPLAAGLAGAVTGGLTGAVTGGIAGGLIDLGVPDEEASYYQDRIGAGAFLVTVNCDQWGEEVRRVLLWNGAEDISGRDDLATANRSANRSGTGETIELREEELVPRKERVEAGGVEVRKEVVTEEVRVGKREIQDTEHVSGTVRREEAHIEQSGDVSVQSDWDSGAGDHDAGGRDFETPQHR